MANSCKLAERIGVYRERLEMTQSDLAIKSGVSIAAIQAIESGEVYPALGVLVKLSRALGQRLGTFMDDQFRPDPIIMRANERANEQVTHKESGCANGFKYYPLGRGKTDRHIEPFYIEIESNAEAQLSAHEGEEFIVVVSGTVELVYGEETHLLSTGDSAYYNSVVQHRVKSANNAPAAIYAAVLIPF